MSCIQCLTQYHYYNVDKGVCYLTSTANKKLAKTSHVISDIKECKPTKTCSDFKVSKYETTTMEVTLPKYESCVVKVINDITYDHKAETEPTFVIASPTEGGVEYSYNYKMQNYLSDPLRDGRIVDHKEPIYVRLTNKGHTLSSIKFKLVAKMRAFKHCIDVEPKSCVNCLSQKLHQWDPKSKMCIDNIPNNMDFDFATHMRDCPANF
jgi:hypothetical protein